MEHIIVDRISSAQEETCIGKNRSFPGWQHAMNGVHFDHSWGLNMLGWKVG